MDPQVSKRRRCEQIGVFLEYPASDPRETLMTFAGQIEADSGEVANCLRDFYGKMKRMDLAMWQEFYVQTFDLMPQCSLYISVHLFGEESFKRAELMAGLKAVYEHRGGPATTELPDHMAVVLRQNALFNDEEWSEFVTMCLLPVIPTMIKKLEKNANPYVLILKAIQKILAEEEVYA